MNNKIELKEDHTYLIQLSSDRPKSVTILTETKTSYLIRWNDKQKTTWDLKSRFKSYYSIIEDISEFFIKD